MYPKDAAQIVGLADVFPGARVVEAGAGSGALSCWLLRAVGEQGSPDLLRAPARLRRDRRQNVERCFGGPPAWRLVVLRARPGQPGPEQPGRRTAWPTSTGSSWTCSRRGTASHTAAAGPAPGGLICCYVATTTPAFADRGGAARPGRLRRAGRWESLLRGWHVDGLAVPPEHRMVGHTGFLVTARRLAPGVTPPPRRRRPAKAAQEEDHNEDH